MRLYLMFFFFQFMVDASWAQPAEQDLNALYQTAAEHYKQKDYQKALQNFQEVYRLTGDAEMLFNVAQCYRLLGQLEKAKESYEKFLADAQGSAQEQNAKQRLLEVESALQARAKPETTSATPTEPTKAEGRALLLSSVGAGAIAATLGGTSIFFATRANDISQRVAEDPGSVEPAEVTKALQQQELARRIAIGADAAIVCAAVLGVLGYSQRKRAAIRVSPDSVSLSFQF
jgi:tetratricopeptide (TPR) repeat protein